MKDDLQVKENKGIWVMNINRGNGVDMKTAFPNRIYYTRE